MANSKYLQKSANYPNKSTGRLWSISEDSPFFINVFNDYYYVYEDGYWRLATLELSYIYDKNNNNKVFYVSYIKTLRGMNNNKIQKIKSFWINSLTQFEEYLKLSYA